MSSLTQPLAVPRMGLAQAVRDYTELIKVRITSLIVLTAWCGYYFGSSKSGGPALSWGLFHALLGIGLVSGGSAALNQVLEWQTDGLMRRTARRPLPSGRMSVLHGGVAGILMTVGGAFYLGLTLNQLTAFLSLATAAAYLWIYTPLKKVHPICTFVGAFPGAMPGVLGWTAARGRLEWGALVMFAIVFFWQFPHFFSIAWLYREDYERGGIRMLPIVEPDGRSTVRQILLYAIGLVPVTLLPQFFGLAGKAYGAIALVLGLGLLVFAVRLCTLGAPMDSSGSRLRARHLLQATVIYLPLLFVVMMLDQISS